MMNLLLAGSVSFFIAFIAIPAIIRVADEKGLFDVPDARKLHTKPIASLGGVGIFIGFLLSLLLCLSLQQNPEFQYFYAASLLMFFLGIKDDILILSASKKLLGQIVAAAIIIHLADIRIDSMHGFLGIHELPNLVSYPLSYLIIIVIVNAFNLIDGVDGLSSSLGILTTAVFGSYFAMANMPAYALLSFGLTGALCAFLVYNYHPAKIFMGDSGSLLLGLINAILAIKFITVADSINGTFPITSSVAIGFSILIVPLLDTMRVFSVRIFNGRSPFSPDRNHIHHLLLDRGFNHSQVTMICLLMNAFFIALAYAGRSLGSTVLLCLMIGSSFALIALLKYWKKRPVLVVASSAYQTCADTPATKIVAFKNEEAAVAEQ
ncbi:MAG TPA: MraY family glycosyltransferase [Flavisolibacter sp.]|nr:MraY family glycosyltransferase [Flavisolibacter sp.]